MGLAMGWALIWVEDVEPKTELPSAYPEFGPRAAIQDFSPSQTDFSSLGGQSFSASVAVSGADAPLFSPGAPIAAEAAPAESPLPANP
ncbi:MAG: hypothetical protein MUE42_14835 [Opitutaceae bacterium]|nr:hypothetical protein [Opitutaceae bacterium]